MNALKNQDAYLAEIDGARIRTEEDIILPWWEGKVVGHMVDGEPRGFMLYIERSKARR